MTPAQLQALKAAINSTPAWAAVPNNDDGHFALAALLNAPASPAFAVWRTDAPVTAIIDGIDFTKYTPADAIPAIDLAMAQYSGRVLCIQTKQMNLQLLLQGRSALDCSKPTLRAGLRDAVTAVPAGVGGANTAPGGASGVAVLTACTRNATEAEKILAAASQGSDTTGTVTARVMGYEGPVSPSDIQQARSLP